MEHPLPLLCISSVVSLLSIKTSAVQPQSLSKPTTFAPKAPNYRTPPQNWRIPSPISPFFFFDKILSLHSLAQKFGPLMLLKFGSVPVLVASSVDGAREIMKTHDLVFSSRPKSTITQRLFYQAKDVPITQHGQYWRELRSATVIHLLSNKRVQSFRAATEEEITLMIEKIKRSSNNYTVVNLSQMMKSFTNDVLCRALLGRKYGAEEQGSKFGELMVDYMSILGVGNVGDFIPWLSWVNHFNGFYARLDRAAKEFDTFIERVLEEHRAKGVSGQKSEDMRDFVDVLLQVQRENKAGFPVDDHSIKGFIVDLFAAGSDTTAVTIEWAMAELLRSPRALKKIQTEVREIGSGKLKINLDDVEKMHYLKAVMKESFRLHPPLPLLAPRESTDRVQVMGYDIAARTQVLVNAWAIGRDPKIWDEPSKFRPERFLNSSVDFKGVNFELIPFGAGRRGCPGINFAMLVDELALANLLYNFDFALPDGVRKEDLDMTEIAGTTVRKRLPLLVAATPCSF